MLAEQRQGARVGDIIGRSTDDIICGALCVLARAGTRRPMAVSLAKGIWLIGDSGLAGECAEMIRRAAAMGVELRGPAVNAAGEGCIPMTRGAKISRTPS